MELKITALKMYRKGVIEDATPKSETNRQWSEYWGGRGHALPEKDTPRGKTRVYVSVQGENLWTDFAARTSRPHTLWAPLVKAALIDAGWPTDVRLRWSQKAGCSCPCSPAFFVTGGPLGLDMWATVEADEIQSTDADEYNRRANVLVNDPTIPVGAA